MKILTSLFPKLLEFCEIPGKIRSKLTKKVQKTIKSAASSENQQKLHENLQNGAKVLKN